MVRNTQIPNAKNLKSSYDLNVQGATIGGIIGLGFGLSTKKNLMVSVIIGIIVGRVIFKK
ncbi:MAG: hypothetical protein ABF244_00590 [Flavobacteriaceae bacterium]